MATEKVQSFVGKFISLWAIGEEVSLTFNAKNGKAKVIMELDLGDLETKNKIVDDVKVSNDFDEKFPRIGQSRLRRRERRSREHKAAHMFDNQENNKENVYCEITEITTENVECEEVSGLD